MQGKLNHRPFRQTALALATAAALGPWAAGPAVAAACTWNPATGNWSTAGSWSCSAVPGGADSANVAGGKVVTVNAAQSILHLTNSGGVNIDAASLTLTAGGSTDNTGGVINIANGAALNQFGQGITGGTINTAGTGAVVANSSFFNILSGLTLNGLLDVATVANARERIGNGMTLNGNVNIANGGIVSLDSQLAAANSVGGAGTFNLNDPGARLALEGTGTTTLGANIVVRGQGNIGQALLAGGTNNVINNGRISADVGGGTLNITPGAGSGNFTNNNLIDARGGGLLLLSTSIGNAAGQIAAQAGSIVRQNGITISGGTIATGGTGTFQAVSSSTNFLNNVSFNGTLDLTTIVNSRERIINGATINGAVNIANGGILSLDSQNTSGGIQTIGGTVLINLNDPGARLAIDGNGSTTLGSGVTVRGQGNIGTALNTGGTNVLTNNGLISSDVAGGTLDITAPGNNGSFINNGTLQAVGGGKLLLSTNILANAGSQIISGAGSSVVQNGVRINGDFTSSGGGSFTAVSSANNFLDAVTFTGRLDLGSIVNARERIVNGATINGAINVANGGILSLDSSATAGGNQTLAGTVVINLNDPAAHLAIEGSGSTTLGSGVTVRGQGNIGTASVGGGVNVLTNNGLILADVGGGTLNITRPGNSGSFINNGTLQAINGATLLLSTDITASGGSLIIAGAGSAVVQNGVAINGVINATGTGVFTASSSSSNVLDGVSFAGTLDLASIANSRERIINGATINGAINLGNGGFLSLDSNATAGGAQTIAGTAVINLNDANARLSIEGNGATTLGSGITVRGQGNIGVASIIGGVNTLTSNGLISADINGATLNIVPPANSGSFINNGTLQAINGARLLLSTNITANAGSQIIAGAGSSVVQNGVAINGVINASGTGVFTASSNSVNVLNGIDLTGTLDLTSIVNSRERIINGATLNGAINLGNGGFLSLDSNSTPGGVQALAGTAVINLNDANTRLSIEGSGTTTLGAGITVRGQGSIGVASIVGGTNTLINNGLISADIAGGTLTLAPPANNGSLVNNNTLQAIGGGELALWVNINNAAGLITAQNASAVVQHGITVTGGTLASSGTGSFQAVSSGVNVLSGVTLAGTLDMTTIVSSRERIINGATINGAVNIGNGGILSMDSNATPGGAQTITGTGVINLNNAGARLAFEGNGSTTFAAGLTVRGQGNIGQPAIVGGAHTLINNGTLLADGGTLTIVNPANSGSLAGTGTLQTSGGTLNLIGLTSPITQGKLVMGGAGSALTMGTQNLTITNDYTSAQSGSGNSFNARAGVSGTGKILASGDASQAITGSNVTNGGTANAALTIGNLRVGANTFSYDIANTGTTGPTLRGAIQTTANGANLTDARLSGSGVTASNYSTGAPGSSSGPLAVTFTAAGAGALAPLAGQVINLQSNFSNIADQKLNIVLAGGAAAYNAAVGSATPNPVTVANQRVGGGNTAALTVSNTAAAGAFSEDLRATFAAASTGNAGHNGGVVSGLAAGGSNAGTMAVSVDTSVAGARTGTVSLNYQTTGTVAGVSNGLGLAGANAPQIITVNGNVYQAAAGAIQTAALNFGTVQVGQVVTQDLVIRNTAVGDNGFVEDLNASFGAKSGSGTALFSGIGSLSGILAGTNSTGANGAMTVAVNTSAAGVINGGIAVNYATAGAVNGVSNGLGAAAAGSEDYGVAGAIQAAANVVNQASPLVNTPAINLGAVRVGAASPAGVVSVTNVATIAPQAALNASITPTSGPVTAGGSFSLLNPGATNNANLVVGLATGAAGNFTGANAGKATIAVVSDANNIGGCGANCQMNLAPQTVSVEGKVYQQAVGALGTGNIDFGVVRVGSTPSASNIVINNTAAVAGLNDTLTAKVSGASGAFSATASVDGIAAQGSGNAAVSLSTAAAGIFSQTLAVSMFSNNADMSDVSAGADGQVIVTAQVNNLAKAVFSLASGAGALSGGGSNYTLDLGDILAGSGLSSLSLANEVSGPADGLKGSFDLSGLNSILSSGWVNPGDLEAGQSLGGLDLIFDALALGQFSGAISFTGYSWDAFNADYALGTITLNILGKVIEQGGNGNVPEPGTPALLLAAAAAGWMVRRRPAQQCVSAS